MAINDDMRLGQLIRTTAEEGYRLAIDGSGMNIVVTLSKFAPDSMTWLDSRYEISRQCIEYSVNDLYIYAINSAKAALVTRLDRWERVHG